MIGNCDCCDRKNVPVSHFNATAAHSDGVACFVCRGHDDPDPYGEAHELPGHQETMDSLNRLTIRARR